MNNKVELLSRVKGFIDEKEGRMLNQLAIESSRLGPCLEIGSYCGKSAIYLGKGCKVNNGILFSIDHHKGSEEQQPGEEYFDPELYNPNSFRVDTFGHFRNNIEAANLEDTVVPIISKSEIVARLWATPLSLVFIDGGHSYETVEKDYDNWVNHILIDGYLIFHDIFKNPDEGGQAPFLLYQKALASGRFEEYPMVKTLGILKRLKI